MFKLFSKPNMCKESVRLYSNRNILRLRERGMYQDIFPDTAAQVITDLTNAGPQCVYAGFDPTADSLHVGNLLVLMNLLHWQRGGHQTIALIGGATARIGDPSGKNSERDEISKVLIETNIAGIKSNIDKVFHHHAKYFWKSESKLQPHKFVNNEIWYKDMSAVDLLSGPARHLRMGTLLSRASVQSRLNSQVGMSLTEFTYQLFQAYDWLYLLENYNCNFQIGGNDQMGNLMSGHDLISKACKKPVYGLTLPIITTEMGDKFGKSAGNAMWLSSKKTSPFMLYQFFVRLPDAQVAAMLKWFTFLSLGEINDVMARHTAKPDARVAQKLLAEQVVLLVHGDTKLQAAKRATDALYDNNLAALAQMRPKELQSLLQGATLVELLPEPGQTMLELAINAKCFANKDDALRIISAGGFYINHQRVNNPSEVLNLNVHRLENNITLIRVGKKNYCVVKWIV